MHWVKKHETNVFTLPNNTRRTQRGSRSTLRKPATLFIMTHSRSRPTQRFFRKEPGMDEDFTGHFALQLRTGFGGNIEQGRQITSAFTSHRAYKRFALPLCLYFCRDLYEEFRGQMRFINYYYYCFIKYFIISYVPQPLYDLL